MTLWSFSMYSIVEFVNILSYCYLELLHIDKNTKKIKIIETISKQILSDFILIYLCRFYTADFYKPDMAEKFFWFSYFPNCQSTLLITNRINESYEKLLCG